MEAHAPAGLSLDLQRNEQPLVEPDRVGVLDGETRIQKAKDAENDRAHLREPWKYDKDGRENRQETIDNKLY